MFKARCITCSMLGRLLAGQVLITDGNLELVDEGIQYIVKTDKPILDK
jgi:hypothetical protein